MGTGYSAVCCTGHLRRCVHCSACGGCQCGGWCVVLYCIALLGSSPCGFFESVTECVPCVFLGAAVGVWVQGLGLAYSCLFYPAPLYCLTYSLLYLCLPTLYLSLYFSTSLLCIPLSTPAVSL